MRKVQYGSQAIEFLTLEKQGLKSHYITVERHSGVVIKGNPVAPDAADQMILKKAPWIIEKLRLVGALSDEELVTGSRLTYLGKSYYLEVVPDATVTGVLVEFNYSQFRIHVPNGGAGQEMSKEAVEKIVPRVARIAEKLHLPYTSLSFRKMTRRWGSGTTDNKIVLNTDAANGSRACC